MINLLKSIVDSITTLISLVISIIASLINFITHIPTYINLLLQMLNVVPTFAYSYAVAGISITVILFLLNRKSGQSK